MVLQKQEIQDFYNKLTLKNATAWKGLMVATELYDNVLI